MDSHAIKKVDSCGGQAIKKYVSWCVDAGLESLCPDTPVKTVSEFQPPATMFQIGLSVEEHPVRDLSLCPLKSSKGLETPKLSQLASSPSTLAQFPPQGETQRQGPERSTRQVEVRTDCYLCPTPQPQDEPHQVLTSLNRLLTSGLHHWLSGHQGARQGSSGKGQRLRCSSDVHPQKVPNEKDKRSSDVTHCSDDLYKTSCDLEKENAHFVVVDMVLEVLEGVKWTLCMRQRGSGSTTKKHTQDQEDNSRTEYDSYPKTFSVVSTDSGFEDCGMDKRPIRRGSQFKKSFKRPLPDRQSSLQSPMMLCSAEKLAQQLVFGFRTQWFPSQELRRGRQSLRTSLQELRGTAPVTSGANVSLSEEIRRRTRMRGTLTWEPPCYQIIFTVQPTNRRSEIVTTQQFLCAGCGTEIEPRYMKKLRYCNYLGRYFCDCCHGGTESMIPGHILTLWDFGRYPVSDFSKQLLDSVWYQPLFDLTCVGRSLYGRVRELERFRDLQQQLLGIKRLLTTCRLSEGVLKEFEQLPGHLTQVPHLLSMDDLLRVKRGHLVPLARAVLRSATAHVNSCQLCLAKGFFCEFCKQKDVLFPFQSETCTRCTECKACFHKDCFQDEECPKCDRIKLRRQLLEDNSSCRLHKGHL